MSKASSPFAADPKIVVEKTSQLTIGDLVKVLNQMVKTDPTTANLPVFKIEFDALTKTNTIKEYIALVIC